MQFRNTCKYFCSFIPLDLVYKLRTNYLTVSGFDPLFMARILEDTEYLKYLSQTRKTTLIAIPGKLDYIRLKRLLKRKGTALSSLQIEKLNNILKP